MFSIVEDQDEVISQLSQPSCSSSMKHLFGTCSLYDNSSQTENEDGTVVAPSSPWIVGNESTYAIMALDGKLSYELHEDDKDDVAIEQWWKNFIWLLQLNSVRLMGRKQS